MARIKWNTSFAHLIAAEKNPEVEVGEHMKKTRGVVVIVWWYSVVVCGDERRKEE